MPSSFGTIGSRRSSGAIPQVLHASSRRQDVGDRGQPTAFPSHHPSVARIDYDVSDSHLNVTEVLGALPMQNQNELFGLDSRSIQELTSHQRTSEASPQRRESVPKWQHVPSRQPPEPEAEAEMALSKWTTELYTVSYLILFATFGTLARLGLQAITFYPGTPVSFSSVWPNFAGSLVIGFLAEDCKLFCLEWGTPAGNPQIPEAGKDEESGCPGSQDLATMKKAHIAVKKTIPLYIGLATGFCGSFTSFSSFIRDIFLALSNDLPMPESVAAPRKGGYSFLALLAVTLGTISLSFSGFYLGGQLATALEPVIPPLPCALIRKYVDPLAMIMAWGSWAGAVILSIVPPDRYSNPGASEFWRGRATFALIFAPLGCLARFYASAHLNPRIASFPLGTFTVNMVGTAVLGLAWDLAHGPEGGVIGCQVFQGIEDGFCGCLTTVSTWVMELAILRHRKAYIYGGVSVTSALALMVAIMGGLRWSQGFSALLCFH